MNSRLLAAAILFAVGLSSAQAEETARKEVSVDVKQRLVDIVNKLEEMDREWKNGKGEKGAKVEAVTKEEKEQLKARKKAAEAAEKEAKAKKKALDEMEKGKAKSTSNSRDGAWVETGGVAHGSRSDSSSGPGYSSSSSYSNTSIGVRTTVIRLED